MFILPISHMNQGSAIAVIESTSQGRENDAHEGPFTALPLKSRGKRNNWWEMVGEEERIW